MSNMHTAYIAITLTTAVVTAAVAVADLIPAGFVLANSAEVGVPRSWLPPLAAVKLAGAAGLIVGLVGLRALGPVGGHARVDGRALNLASRATGP